MKKPASITLIIFFLCSFQFLSSQNLTNNGSAITISEGATFTIEGNIIILSEVDIDNSGDIFVGGNWVNNAPVDIHMQENTGTVTFNGSLPQTIGGTSSTYFSKLKINQNTGLGSETYVSALLGLTNAKLTLNDYSFFTQPGSQITGTGQNAYIIAEGEGLLMREVGELDVEFPVGTNTSYLPATLNNSGTPDNYGINVFGDVLDGGLTGITISEIDNCVNNTWNITEEVLGGSDLSLTVQWNGSDEGPLFDRGQSGIGHFTGGAWDPQDTSSATGAGPYSLTRAEITSLSAFAVGDINSPMVIKIVYNEQEILLSQGWAGISTYLDPVDPGVEEILAPVISELIIMQNQTGMYWPGQGINTLGSWETHTGYQIKMSGEIKLTITGTTEINTTLNLSDDWNLIPVLANCDIDVEGLFSGTSVIVVKSVASPLVYWPEYGINTLEKLKPGSAYMVLMGTEESIIFPECDKAPSLSPTPSPALPLEGKGETAPSNLTLKQIAEIAGISEVLLTPNTHTVAIPESAFSGIKIQAGDIIGAFDENTNCYGLALWMGENLSITLFGDDQTTPLKDGFDDGSPLYFKVFQSATGWGSSLEAAWDNNLPDNSGLFVTNGISAIDGFKQSSTGIYNQLVSDIKIYPNPANERITIARESTGQAGMKIFNMQGLEVMSQNLNNPIDEVNISMLSPGPYLIKIHDRKSSYVQRLIKK